MNSLLLIDDDAATLKAYTAVLNALESTLCVTNALSAEAALRYVQAMPFDAVVCDFMLPGLDGLEFMTNCASVQSDTPVILITGSGDAELQKGRHTSGGLCRAPQAGRVRSLAVGGHTGHLAETCDGHVHRGKGVS